MGFFILDIIFEFRTSYLDADKNEVVDWKRIANRYLRSFYFYIDTVSTIPFGYFVQGGRNLEIFNRQRFHYLISENYSTS